MERALENVVSMLKNARNRMSKSLHKKFLDHEGENIVFLLGRVYALTPSTIGSLEAAMEYMLDQAIHALTEPKMLIPMAQLHHVDTVEPELEKYEEYPEALNSGKNLTIATQTMVGQALVYRTYQDDAGIAAVVDVGLSREGIPQFTSHDFGYERHGELDGLTERKIYFATHIVLVATMWGEHPPLGGSTERWIQVRDQFREWLVCLYPIRTANAEVYIEIILCLAALRDQVFIESYYLETLKMFQTSDDILDSTDIHEVYHTFILYALLFAVQTKYRRICLLFLAHDHVQNPYLWTLWRAQAGHESSALQFYVYDSNNRQHLPGWMRVPFSVTTAWNTPSLVTAHMASLRHILASDTTVQIVYLVSGYDVPIVCPSILLGTDITKSRVQCEQLEQYRVTATHCRPPDEEYTTFAIGSQWVATSRELAAMLVTVDFTVLEKYRTYLTKRYGMRNNISPDEFYLPTMIRTQNWEVLNTAITGQEKRKSTDSSPITWYSLDRLRSAIISQSKTFFFFRKVASLSPPMQRRLLLIVLKRRCLMGHEYDEKSNSLYRGIAPSIVNISNSPSNVNISNSPSNVSNSSQNNVSNSSQSNVSNISPNNVSNSSPSNMSNNSPSNVSNSSPSNVNNSSMHSSRRDNSAVNDMYDSLGIKQQIQNRDMAAQARIQRKQSRDLQEQ